MAMTLSNFGQFKGKQMHFYTFFSPYCKQLTNHNQTWHHGVVHIAERDMTPIDLDLREWLPLKWKKITFFAFFPNRFYLFQRNIEGHC